MNVLGLIINTKDQYACLESHDGTHVVCEEIPMFLAHLLVRISRKCGEIKHIEENEGCTVYTFTQTNTQSK